MNGFEAGGKRLKVEVKKDKTPGEGGGGGADSNGGPAGCNLFVFYCPDPWEDEDLKKAFEVSCLLMWCSLRCCILLSSYVV